MKVALPDGPRERCATCCTCLMEQIKRAARAERTERTERASAKHVTEASNTQAIRAELLENCRDCALFLDALTERAQGAGKSSQLSSLQARVAVFRSRLEAEDWSLALADAMDAFADDYNAFFDDTHRPNAKGSIGDVSSVDAR